MIYIGNTVSIRQLGQNASFFLDIRLYVYLLAPSTAVPSRFRKMQWQYFKDGQIS